MEKSFYLLINISEVTDYILESLSGDEARGIYFWLHNDCCKSVCAFFHESYRGDIAPLGEILNLEATPVSDSLRLPA